MENATGIVFASVGLLALFTLIAFRYHKYRLHMKPVDFDELNRKMLENGTILAGQLFSDRKPRELKRSDVVLLEKVGRGAFSTVWKGILDESASSGRPEYQVAAKIVRNTGTLSVAATEDLTTEAAVMAHLVGHKNLVSLVGVVTSGTPLILVMAYCDHGSMVSYLTRRAADGSAVQSAHKIDFGAQTARGMEHLSGRHFIHRDLAARNVLLTSGQSISNLVCKVADFGLSRAGGRSGRSGNDGERGEVYYKSHTGGAFPVRWTAPEAMGQFKFTHASDAWSFGIFAIEMIQDGTKPFPDIESNHGVVRYTLAGGVHPMPTECEADSGLLQLYTAACKCFTESPHARPTFSELVASLEDLGLVDVGDCKDKRPTCRSTAALLGLTDGHGNMFIDDDDSQSRDLDTLASIYEYSGCVISSLAETGQRSRLVTAGSAPLCDVIGNQSGLGQRALLGTTAPGKLSHARTTCQV
jgi:serine/threonine protein kinase